MASPYQQEEGDDDMAAERELADDAMWKVIQKNTFTRWTNENLKSSKLNVIDLDRDLSDGLKLIALIEVLSGKKFQKYNKRPTFRTQKFENVTMSLKFLEDVEGIKLVNIDSSDIVDQKAKLIMGLIWTLILHYSISMPMWEGEDPSLSKDQTPKQRLLAWIQSKIPEKRITNFASDWNDGTAIAALVDALAPGLLPDWPNLNPAEKIKNAKAAMDLAEKWLEIPQLIKPDEMCNPSVDELSMMTYLSRFPNAHLKPGAPVQEKTNPARVRAFGPGLEPTGNVVGAPARFIVETVGAGKGDLEVAVFSPKGAQEKCHVVFNNDRTLSYTCVYTPTTEGQYKVAIKFASKEIPKSPYSVGITSKGGDAGKVIAQGPGIEKTGVMVKRKTYFEVITKGAGVGMVDVGIVDPQGRKDTIKPMVTRKSDDVWYVEYTAQTTGLHSVNVFFSGKPIPKSPFPVGVSPEGGPLIDAAKLPKPVACTPEEAALSSLATPLKAAPGSTAPAPAEPFGKPVEPGKKQPGAAPGKVPIDAKKCWATGRGIQPKGLRVGEDAIFQVHTEGAGDAEPRVMIMGPGGVPEKSTIKKIETTFEYVYKPTKPGLYIINITFGGQQIPRSPFKVEVALAKTSKVRAHGPGLETGIAGTPATFTVEPNGEGPIGFRIDGPSQAKIDVKKEPNGNMQVSYLPTAPGEYAVHVLSNNDDIPKSPFMANITGAGTTPAPPAAPTPGFDASKVTASGPGLEKQGVTINKWAEFTVDTRQAGQASLQISAIDIDSKKVDVIVTDNKNGTYSCRYMPTKSVKYTITITYGGVNIKNSPYEVFVQGLANASKVKVSGPAVEAPVKAKFTTYLIIDCKEAGPGEPNITLTNEKGLQVQYQKIDNKDRTFRVEFVAQTVGVYTAIITFASQQVPKSPFKITVESGVDISKVKVYGPAVEQPVYTSQLTYLIVDCKEAGPGVPLVTLTNEKGVQVPVKVTDNKDSTFKVEFTATVVGIYTANVQFAGQPVPKSPFKINVQSSVTLSKVLVKGLPETIPVNKEVSFDVVTAGAGPGQAKVNIISPTGKVVPTKVEPQPEVTVSKFIATEVGQHTVQVTFADQPVPGSPFKVIAEAPNPFRVRVYGPAVEKPVVANTPTYLIVDFKEAGPGEPQISLVNDKGVAIPITTLDNKDKTFRVEFVATTVGIYTASVTFANQPVPNSPFKITVEHAADASKVKVYGPAVEKPVAVHQSTYLIVDCKDAGPGEPQVTLTSETGVPVIPTLTDNKDKTYRVDFTTDVVGILIANVSFANHSIPNSPFKIKVEPAAHVSKVKVYGPAVEKPVKANQPSYLIIDGKEAGPGEPHVTLTSEAGVPITPTITDNKDNTYRADFTTDIVGTVTANVSYAHQPVPNSPFKIKVEPAADVSKVKVYGPAIERPVKANQTSYLIIDGKEAGPGEPQVTLTTESGVQVPVHVTDNKDKTYKVDFNTDVVGTLTAAVSYAHHPVPHSPFKVSVQPDLSKVHVKELPSTIPVGKEVPFHIVTAGAGKATAKVDLVSPSGKVTPSPVEERPDGFVGKVKATEPGPHTVQVAFADQPVPHSPFSVTAVDDTPVPSTVVDASKVKAYGPGLTKGTSNSPCDFTIDTRAAGPGSLGLTIDGPTEAKIECFDKGGGLFDVRYLPTEPGEYTTNILFDDKPIPNSPFKAQINPAKMVDVTGIKTYGPGVEPAGVFLDSISEFTVDAKSVTPTGEGKVKVLITNPSGTLTEGLVTNKNDGTYQCLYTPFEQGPNTIDVTYEGIRVPHSPFAVDAHPGCDPSKVKVYGPGIQGGQPNKPQKFTINTRGAGPGGVGLSVVGPTEPQVGCVDNQDGTLTVEYLPDTPGDYEIGITFADHPVPGSPFRVPVAETTPFYPERVKCFGPGLNPKGIRKGTKAVFSVVTAQAGVAQLEVHTTDIKTGERKPATVIQRPSGTYDVEYTPDGDGPYKIDVTYGGQPIPNSPFTTEIQPSQDVTKVAITGEGIKPHGVPASVPVAFTIDTRQSGDAPLEVEVKTPQGKTTKPDVTPFGDGTYKVSYNPEEVGEYVVDVKYAGQKVPNGPFHVKTVPTGSAEKVEVPEHIQPQLAVGETNTITVKKSEAGYGNITFQMHKITTTTTTTTTTTVKDVDYTVVDNNDGTVTIKYTPLSEGTYTADIKFGGVTVPHGHFTQQVGKIVEQTVQQTTVTATPASPSSDVRPVDFPSIPVGPDISQVSAVITTPSNQQQVPRIIDNKDGTIKIGYQATEVGQHVLQTFYNNAPVPGGNYNFFVHSTKPGHVSAVGPGLIGGISGQPTSFTVITKDAGPGGLGLAIEGPSKAEIQCKDNKDGTATITYTPVVPGDYKIIVKFAGQMIPGAPYTAKITPPPGQEPSKQSHMTLGTTRQMSLTVSETDLTNLTATIQAPSGSKEPVGLKKQPNGQLGISFTPREVGEHWVNVFRNGQPIPGSPFKIIISGSEVGNAKKVKVIGKGIVSGLANEVNEFTIDTKEAGVASLSLSVQGPSKADIKCLDNPDGTTRVTYKPTEPGNYQMTVKYGDEHVPGSPFSINVGGQSSGRVTERIVRQQQAGIIKNAGSTCELNINMAGINIHDIEGTVTSPSGATEKCDVIDLGGNRYTIKFFPKEIGVHTVSLKNKGIHIPGSPFQFTVGPILGGGPEKVRAVGSGLERGEANKPSPFTIITREAGAGALSLGIEGPSKAVIDFQDRRDGTSDVNYVVTEAGEYLVSVKFNDQHIPDSPFKVYIQPAAGDSKKLHVQNLQQRDLQVNSPTQFTVDFNGAHGRLNAKVVAPSGAETEATVHEVQKDRYAVNFVPRESGVHYVHVTLNGNHVPGSPYPVQVGKQDADASRVRAYGDGLHKGQTGQVCKFIVNTVNAGSGSLSIAISGPSKIELQSRELEEGYEFSYIPLAPGDYFITIKYAGNAHIPGSPFKAHIEGAGKPAEWMEQSRVVVQTVTKTTTVTQQYTGSSEKPAEVVHQLEAAEPDASKVTVMGNGLQQAAVNQEAVFMVDGSKAGYNMLMVGISGPQIPCEKILIIHLGGLHYSVRYQLSQPGNYVLVVKWGDTHILGSPFNIVAK